MASSWEEVKRLAADFQRAQLSSSIQRLSDRNCIEIVKKLISLKFIDVVFTTSGKEYLTPQHLQKEIRDELIVAGGRVDLSTLASNLQVDIMHVEAAVGELIKTEKDLKLVLGQLITEGYMDQLAEEVNERLQQKGELSVADIIKNYDIPADFLRSGIMARLGRLIKGQTDDREVIYTESFVTMHRYRIRGVLSAVTQPIQIGTLIKNYSLPQRIVISIIEQLISQKKLSGSLSGHDERAFYLPEIYSRAQKEWITNCFSQNGFLEYDALSRLGLGDPKSFVKSFLQKQNKNILFLTSVCVGDGLLAQVESSIEEAHLTGSWVDVGSLLPSQLSPSDVNQIIQHILNGQKAKQSLEIMADTLVASGALIESCMKTFEPLMAAKAEKDLQSGMAKIFEETQTREVDVKKEDVDKKEERRKKAAGGKSGGGTQGRETKTKSTKKKGFTKQRRGNESDSDDEGPATKSKSVKSKELVFMFEDEIKKHLLSLELLQDCHEELAKGIAAIIYRHLNQKYKEVIQSMYLSSMNTSGSDRRKTHAQLQDRICVALSTISLYSAGLELFDGDLKTQLTKHLLRTLCTDLFNSIVVYLAAEVGLPVDTENPNPDQRLKMISKLGGVGREPLVKVHQSLLGGNMEEFLTNMEGVYGAGVLDMMVRIDKKRDRQAMSGHKMALLEQLEQATEPALVLHLAVLILVQMQAQKMVHFSGKFVPQMVAFLKGKVDDEVHTLLVSVQDLVVRMMGEQSEEVAQELQGLAKKLKEVVVGYKRKPSESK